MAMMGRFPGKLTHFLCLPLVNASSKAQLEQSLEAFRRDVTGGAQRASATSVDAGNESGNLLPTIPSKALRPMGVLHLTLGVMSLTKEEQLIGAADYLQSLDLAAIMRETGAASPESTTNGDIRVHLRGLESMHDVKNTSILYAAPKDPTNRLYPFCLAVQKAFKAKGFLLEQNRKLKLHVTMINTIYATNKTKRTPKNKSGNVNLTGQPISDHSKRTFDAGSHGHGPKANAPLQFDARSICDKYKDYVWADSIVLDRISICEMGAKKIKNSDGRVIDECYTEVASIRWSA